MSTEEGINSLRKAFHDLSDLATYCRQDLVQKDPDAGIAEAKQYAVSALSTVYSLVFMNARTLTETIDRQVAATDACKLKVKTTVDNVNATHVAEGRKHFKEFAPPKRHSIPKTVLNISPSSRPYLRPSTSASTYKRQMIDFSILDDIGAGGVHEAKFDANDPRQRGPSLSRERPGRAPAQPQQQQQQPDYGAPVTPQSTASSIYGAPMSNTASLYDTTGFVSQSNVSSLYGTIPDMSTSVQAPTAPKTASLYSSTKPPTSDPPASDPRASVFSIPPPPPNSGNDQQEDNLYGTAVFDGIPPPPPSNFPPPPPPGGPPGNAPPPPPPPGGAPPAPPPMEDFYGVVEGFGHSGPPSMPPPASPPQKTPEDDDDNFYGVVPDSDASRPITKRESAVEPPDDYLCLATAIYEYEATADDELSFDVNDVIYVVFRNDDGWFEGILQRNGNRGLFPGNYVEQDDEEV